MLMILNRDFYSSERRLDAATALGDFRAKEAVPFLVAHLQWDDGPHEEVTKVIRFYSKISVPITNELNRPASTALIKIGIPSISALLNLLKESDDPKTIQKCVFI